MRRLAGADAGAARHAEARLAYGRRRGAVYATGLHILPPAPSPDKHTLRGGRPPPPIQSNGAPPPELAGSTPFPTGSGGPSLWPCRDRGMTSCLFACPSVRRILWPAALEPWAAVRLPPPAPAMPHAWSRRLLHCWRPCQCPSAAMAPSSAAQRHGARDRRPHSRGPGRAARAFTEPAGFQ